MLADLRRIKAAIRRAKTPPTDQITASSFPADPVGYAKQILGIDTLWDTQADILRALLEPPYRVAVRAGHSVGKSFLAAVATNWFYDSFDPSICITTAPDARAVKDILWSEIRIQRQRAGLGGLQPAAPEMRDGPVHWAKGYTAASGEGFQGRHRDKMLFVFDEAVGIDPVFWETVETMFSGEAGHAWLVIYNPTDTTSQAFIEDHSTQADGSPKWRTFTLSCLDHPNITKNGDYIPGAVSRKQVDDWVQAWCQPVKDDDRQSTDIVWDGKLWRPGPIFEARCLGRWPTMGAYSVWSDALWGSVSTLYAPLPRWDECLPQIGCDVARGGDDYTTIHSRWGRVSLNHGSWNGLLSTQIHERLITEAETLARMATATKETSASPVRPVDIVIKIDDDGTGGAVAAYMQAQGFQVIQVGAGTRAIAATRYPNKRSELWFQVMERARQGLISLVRIEKAAKERLRQQLLVSEWAVDASGRRVVEPKDRIKEKIGRSPDDADAFNLAYYECQFEGARGIDIGGEWDEPRRKRQIFGR